MRLDHIIQVISKEIPRYSKECETRDRMVCQVQCESEVITRVKYTVRALGRNGRMTTIKKDAVS